MQIGIIARYGTEWNLGDVEPVTLGEGNTPLVPLPHLPGEPEVWVKVEGQNPTGSFKDRGMTVAVTMARAAGKRVVICASTGNTSASAAAYGARAGLTALVVVPEGQIAPGKMLQAQMYGARIVEVEGRFDRALALVREAVATHPEWELVNSINPYRILGQESAAYEVVDALEGAPDWLLLPVGNAGNITAYFRGFRRRGRGLPRLVGVQAEGAAAMVLGRDLEHPQTVASAIQIGKPASRAYAQEAMETSGGRFLAVSDSAILEAQQALARQGIFVEPASADRKSVV